MATRFLHGLQGSGRRLGGHTGSQICNHAHLKTRVAGIQGGCENAVIRSDSDHVDTFDLKVCEQVFEGNVVWRDAFENRIGGLALTLFDVKIDQPDV